MYLQVGGEVGEPVELIRDVVWLIMSVELNRDIVVDNVSTGR